MKRLARKLGKMIAWFPVIWNDHDWDHDYLYRIIAFKLGRMENAIRNGGISSQSEATADRIRTARLAIERLIADEYWTFQAYRDLLVPEDFMGPEREKARLEDEADGGAFFSFVSTLPDEHLPRFRELSARAEQLKKQDLELFARMFVKYSQTWWD